MTATSSGVYATRRIAMWMVLLVCASALSPPPASAMQRIALRPEGKWSVEYAESKCVIRHNYFGPNDRPYQLSMDLGPLNSVVWTRITTASGPINSSDGENATLTIDDKPVGPKTHYNVYSGNGSRVIEFMLASDLLNIANIQGNMTLTAGHHAEFGIPLPKFPAVWQAGKACLTDLNAKLGLANYNPMTVSTPARGNAHLPDITSVKSIRFSIFYWIDTKGKVDQCHVFESSGDIAFDEQICDSVRSRSIFEPALDKTGNPIRMPKVDEIYIQTTNVLVQG